jgi:hypothetical protein
MEPLQGKPVHMPSEKLEVIRKVFQYQIALAYRNPAHIAQSIRPTTGGRNQQERGLVITRESNHRGMGVVPHS